MLLAQILGGLFGLAIVWIPVRFFEKREQIRIDNDLLTIAKEKQKALAEIKRNAKYSTGTR
jgi:hypothetical protein